MRHADVVVVGGGSAGCVLAARLSDDPARHVLLVEAGEDPATPAPIGRLPLGPTSTVATSYEVELTEGRSAFVPRGSAVGGSGAVNGAYFVRATDADFARWPAAWSADAVLPYFRRVERDLDFTGPRHGADGPVTVRRVAGDAAGAVTRSFADAARAAGWPAEPDKNAGGAGGVGPVPLNVDGDRRASTAHAYLDPARGRANLEIRTHTRVDRVVFRGDTVVGVDVVDGTEAGHGARQTVRASTVVLCAGAFETPCVLLRSGLGPADELTALSIPVTNDLPGVGRGFTDHPELLVPYAFDTGAHAESFSPARALLEACANTPEFELRPYTAPFARSIEGLESIGGGVAAGLGLGVALMRTDSTGTLALDSADPTVPPRVRYGYLRTAHDRACAAAALDAAHDVLAAWRGVRFDPIRAGGAAPLPLELLGTSQHMCGSARMGGVGDPGAVVDERCAVRGVRGLFVADASAIPVAPSRGPHATVVMLAERAAEFVSSLSA
ncbi:mycofactocin system GMC family oxidoreductase MftG [Rhodococcus sp. HNM0569]|uniref:mycofactocin dehydrogenase MftG n=1 Tax=Rhodococcus sp. HNM0569 TaxID=2716340 RepID=UPI003211E538